MMGLTIGSLFSGIGGLELGLELSGLGPVVWQVESDPKCRAVLAKHWPNARRFDDVRTVGATNLDRVDLICGGSPCQDISLAGRGAGLEGAQSGLWFEYARIVGELRPRFVVVENVAALIARGLDRILGSLAACGYDAIWLPLRAADVGAPHRRERIFVVGWRVSDADNAGRSQQRGASADETARAAAQCGCEPMAHSDGQRCEGIEASRLHARGERGHHAFGRSDHAFPPGPLDVEGWRAWSERGGAEPAVCRGADGLSGRLDRLRMLGNAVVPQCAEVVGRVVEMLWHGGAP